MRAATEGSIPPVMPQGNLVEVLGREVRQGSPGELMGESSPSRQTPPPCKTNKGLSDEASYLLTYSRGAWSSSFSFSSCHSGSQGPQGHRPQSVRQTSEMAAHHLKDHRPSHWSRRAQHQP